jgi:glycine hydroxymethyltransferase
MNNKKNKDIIIDLINKEKTRQLQSIGLVASENYVSDNVLGAIGSVLTNKYSEGYPCNRYYGGCQIVDKIENIAIKRAQQLFNVAFANVQPHSGSQANAAVYFSCLNPGDSILGFNTAHGGHLTHGSLINFSGVFYKSFFYGVDKYGFIDYDNMKILANRVKPKLIICGASSYSRDIDYKIFRSVADSVNAILLADISHTAGLIATGCLNNPFNDCHIVTSTTHKTLRGPRGGLILIKKKFNISRKGVKKDICDLINNAVFPGIQGGPAQNIIAAKSISFKEALSNTYLEYSKKIILNSKALSKALMNRKYKIITGGTDNHSFLIDLTNKHITGLDAQICLEKSDIACNKNMIPFDSLTPYFCSGIRLGTAAITTRGVPIELMDKIAYLIDEAISHNNNFLVLRRIKKEVNKMMLNYPLFEL